MITINKFTADYVQDVESKVNNFIRNTRVKKEEILNCTLNIDKDKTMDKYEMVLVI